MQDNEKKPALRFKGFTDPWEQRKLGEIAVFSKGVGYSKNDLCEEGTPIILYGRLYTKYETCIFDVDTFVNVRRLEQLRFKAIDGQKAKFDPQMRK